MMRAMRARLAEWNPFKTPEAQRLAILFAVVYFAQGMWYLPKQPITIVLKDRGLSAGQVADFFFIATFPWLFKPIYGLMSDFVPLFGYRRRSYFFLSTSLASVAGLVLAASDLVSAGTIRTSSVAMPMLGVMTFTIVTGVWLYTLMGLGLAFGDVLTDATMVENGRPRGLTGAFQSVQWAAITAASVIGGVLGGYLAGTRNLRVAFLVAASFPLLSLFMIARFVRETPTRRDRAAFGQTWSAIKSAFTERDVWAVAGFIFFFAFSPSFGPAFVFYQTDTLKFSQEFIGAMDAVSAAGQVVGALLYAPISRRLNLKRIIVWVIGLSAFGTLGFLLYRDHLSTIVISAVFGVFGIMALLAFLDLAAKACPKRVEATFFALLMSVYNAGMQLSENVGARLYDAVGFTTLVFISAAVTALAWALVPMVPIDHIEEKARAEAAALETAESAPAS
jgi:MFS family permease